MTLLFSTFSLMAKDIFSKISFESRGTAYKNFFIIYKIPNLLKFSNCDLQESENTEQRIQSLINSLKHMVYEYICRCLFKVSIIFLKYRCALISFLL